MYDTVRDRHVMGEWLHFVCIYMSFYFDIISRNDYVAVAAIPADACAG